MTNFEKALNQMFNSTPKFKILCNCYYLTHHSCIDCPIKEKCSEHCDDDMITEEEIEKWLEGEVTADDE